MKNNKDIKEAIFNLKQVSGIKNIQRNIELKEKRRRDEKAALDYATETGLERGFKQGVEHGLQEGIQQGKEEQLKEVVSNMNALGISMEQIQKITKLSEKKLKSYLKLRRVKLYKYKHIQRQGIFSCFFTSAFRTT